MNFFRTAITIGICMPETCSPQLFESMLNKIVNQNETLFKIPYKTCQIKEDYSIYTVTDKIAMYVKQNNCLTPLYSY